MIIKVQAPLSDPSDDMCLCYPKGRKTQTVQKVKPCIMAVLNARPSRKAYFEAELETLGGYFKIGNQVEDQEW